MAPSMRTLLAVGLLICNCWNSDVAELPALLFAVVLDVHAPRPSATATARARYDVCRPLAKLITSYIQALVRRAWGQARCATYASCQAIPASISVVGAGASGSWGARRSWSPGRP